MTSIKLPRFGSRVGGYVFIGLVSPHPFTGEERWRVECARCGGSCVRLARAVRKNERGCKRCSLAETRSSHCVRAGKAGAKATAEKMKVRRKRGGAK